ncbi:MAG: hypothetical protein M0Z47_09350 [Actinomycetota bacterium]|nr:hypothetical protein [Actinomycetota bacterium]
MANLVVRAAGTAVEVRGAQAAPFLHSQLTQDVEGLSVGSAARALLLEPNGHMIAVAELARLEPEAFALVLHPSLATALTERLSRFLIRTKAVISPAYAVDLAATKEGIPSALAPGLGWVRSDGQDVDEGLSAAVRMLGGVPALGVDLDEGALPNSLGDLSAYASFTKGCYTGQELVERVESRKAAPPRRLFAVSVSEGKVAPGDELFSQHDPVGRVTTVAELSGERAEALAAAFADYDPSWPQLAWCVLSRNRHPAEVERAGSAGAEERRVRLAGIRPS